MAFTTILMWTLAVYVIYYAANVIYDLFFSADDREKQPEEEEFEILEEDNTLTSTSFSDHVETIENSAADQVKSIEAPISPEMNGGISIDELIAEVSSSSPSELSYIVQAWNK